jgi:hypothetical protein
MESRDLADLRYDLERKIDDLRREVSDLKAQLRWDAEIWEAINELRRTKADAVATS